MPEWSTEVRKASLEGDYPPVVPIAMATRFIDVRWIHNGAYRAANRQRFEPTFITIGRHREAQPVHAGNV